MLGRGGGRARVIEINRRLPNERCPMHVVSHGSVFRSQLFEEARTMLGGREW